MVHFLFNDGSNLPQTPESGKQSPCNGVGSCTPTPPQGQTFSTPPARRKLTAAQFQDIHSVSLHKTKQSFSLGRYSIKAQKCPHEDVSLGMTLNQTFYESGPNTFSEIILKSEKY